MPDPDIRKKISQLKDKIRTWTNRAEMARQQGSGDLVKKAREHKHQLENELAKVQ